MYCLKMTILKCLYSTWSLLWTWYPHINIPHVFLTNISSLDLKLNFWLSFLTPPRPPSPWFSISQVMIISSIHLLSQNFCLPLTPLSDIYMQSIATSMTFLKTKINSYPDLQGLHDLPFPLAFSLYLPTLSLLQSYWTQGCSSNIPGTLSFQDFLTCCISSAWNDLLPDTLCPQLV